jgi:hypothetical protein
MSAAVGQIETNKGTDWGAKNTICKKTTYSLRDDNFVSRRLQKASTKIGKIFTLYHRELMKKRPILCMFCTQSAIRVLTRLFELTALFESKNKHLLSLFHSPVCVCVCVFVFLSGHKKATSAVLN